MEPAAMRSLLYNANDLRNHVTAALNQNGIADLDTQPLDFILIVQSGT
jgi:hypothetical protein